MSDIREPLHGETADRMRAALRRSGVPNGAIRANIAGHGSFTIRAIDLDAVIEEHWGDTPAQLIKSIKDAMGDPYYDASGMTKIELIMVVAELSGLGTN